MCDCISWCANEKARGRKYRRKETEEIMGERVLTHFVAVMRKDSDSAAGTGASLHA